MTGWIVVLAFAVGACIAAAVKLLAALGDVVRSLP